LLHASLCIYSVALHQSYTLPPAFCAFNIITVLLFLLHTSGEHFFMHERNTFGAYSVYLFLSVASVLGMQSAWTVSVYQVEVVRLSPLQLVLVGTVLELGMLILQVPTGIVADLYSRRLSVIIGYLLLGSSYLLQGLVPSFEAILLAQVVLAAGFAFVSGAEEAWITGEIGEENAGKTFLRATQLQQIGALAAVPLGITLANLFLLNTPIIVGGAILVVMSAFLIVFMPENNFEPVVSGERTTWHALLRQMREGGHAVRASRMLLSILGFTLFVGLASEGFDRLNTAHFLQDFTLPDLWGLKPVTWFGIISVGTTLLTLPATEIVHRIVDTSKPRRVIGSLLALNILLIVCTVVFGLVGNFYVAVGAYWGACVVRAVSSPLYSTWITQHTDAKQRATIFSFVGMVDPLGQIAGGPLIGIIGERFSLRAAMVAVGLILSPVLLFLVRALNLSRHTQSRVEEKEG
jgi:DHA3 family tetracycline resistance protein-like MFS transporter